MTSMLKHACILVHAYRQRRAHTHAHTTNMRVTAFCSEQCICLRKKQHCNEKIRRPLWNSKCCWKTSWLPSKQYLKTWWYRTFNWHKKWTEFSVILDECSWLRGITYLRAMPHILTLFDACAIPFVCTHKFKRVWENLQYAKSKFPQRWVHWTGSNKMKTTRNVCTSIILYKYWGKSVRRPCLNIQITVKTNTQLIYFCLTCQSCHHLHL